MEFLPLCDVLFNVISLAEYFCHILFDFVFLYAVYAIKKDRTLAIVILCILLSSLIVSQVSDLLCTCPHTISSDLDSFLADRLSKMVLKLKSSSGREWCSRCCIPGQRAGPGEHAKNADHVR